MRKSSPELDSNFIVITSILIVLLGAPSFLSVIKNPNQSTFEVVDSRGPASISENDTNAGLSLSSNTTVEIPCNKDLEVLETQAAYLRLKGTNCSDKKPQKISITNRTNGFTAAIIPTGGDTFTTDFIDLQNGENVVAIETLDQDGSKSINTMKLNKRKPASLKE
jgi:hypothetical protein